MPIASDFQNLEFLTIKTQTDSLHIFTGYSISRQALDVNMTNRAKLCQFASFSKIPIDTEKAATIVTAQRVNGRPGKRTPRRRLRYRTPDELFDEDLDRIYAL